MKTKEFIKLLQEADPSGELHIRMEGGIPSFVEPKEGYWDGPYSYIDDDGSYVTSIKNGKLDIHCTDIDGFIEQYIDIHDPNNWEYVKSKFKFELDGYHNTDERVSRFFDNVRISYDQYYEIYNRHFMESEKRSVENINNGWSYFQNKSVDDENLNPNLHHYYTWKIYDDNGKEMVSNIYNVGGVYKSKKFQRVDNNKKSGYYEWKLIKN